MRKLILATVLLGIATPVWADGTIDSLSAGGALTGTEKIPMFQTANPAVTTTPNALKTFVAAPTAANPTATIGTSAVNGTAATFMRSDAAPAFGNLTGPVTSTGLATTIANGAITNAMLANSSMTLAGHSVSLGGSQTFACADLSNGASGCSTSVGTIATQNANAVAITGGTEAGLTGFAIRDTSAAFDVTVGATSSTTLSAGRTLTIDMVNASSTLKLGTAGTKTFPGGSDTLAGLGTAQSWTKAQRGTPVNITISTATFTPNFDNSQNFEIDLTSACPCTLANPSTTLVAGQSGVIEIHQDGSGSRTIGTWGTDYQYVGGTSTITLSTAASAVDYLPYYVNNAATGIVLGSLLKAPAH